MKLVFDTSSLIILYQSNKLTLVDKICKRLNAELLLLNDVEFELSSIPIKEILSFLSMMRINYDVSEDFLPQLGKGERAVISYILNLTQDAVAIIDDLKARQFALELDLKFTGIIGLIARGFETCTIKTKQELSTIWKEWKEYNFRMHKLEKLESFTENLSKE